MSEFVRFLGALLLLQPAKPWLVSMNALFPDLHVACLHDHPGPCDAKSTNIHCLSVQY